VLCEIQERPKKLYIETQFYFDRHLGALDEENPLYEELNDFGVFKGFMFEMNGLQFTDLAYVNDNSKTFDNVIEIIEKYF